MDTHKTEIPAELKHTIFFILYNWIKDHIEKLLYNKEQCICEDSSPYINL